MSAVETFTTGCCKRRNHVVTDFEDLHFGSDFVNVAGELVAHDEVGVGFLVAAVDMKLTGNMAVRLGCYCEVLSECTFRIVPST